MSKWADLYANEISQYISLSDYYFKKIKHKIKFINNIKKYANKNTVAEFGGGTAVCSIYLKHIGMDVTVVDKDKDIIEISKSICDELKYEYPKYELLDFFNYNSSKVFDVIFHNGVLEHFSEEDLKRILDIQLKHCDYCIFGVPTTYFKQNEAMYGDEHYLPDKFWKKIIKEVDGTFIDSFSMHFDGFFKIIFNVKKWFKPFPFRVYVVKSNRINTFKPED